MEDGGWRMDLLGPYPDRRTVCPLVSAAVLDNPLLALQELNKQG